MAKKTELQKDYKKIEKKVVKTIKKLKELQTKQNKSKEDEEEIKELNDILDEFKTEVHELGARQQKVPIDEIIKSLYIKRAFYGYLLSKIKRFYSYSIPTAAISLKRRILINPVFFAILNKDEQMGVLEHECLHLAMLHFKRFFAQMTCVEFKEIINIAMDGAINQISIFPQCKGSVTYELLVELTKDKDLKKEDTAEYYFKKLMERYDEIMDKIKNDPAFKKMVEDLMKGHDKSLQDSMNADGTGMDPVMESAMRNILQKAKEYQKKVDRQAGTEPGDSFVRLLPRYVNIDKNIWKRAINHCIGFVPVADTYQVYNRPNRRNKLSNWGNRHVLENNKLYVGIDTSASISDDELEQFLGHISRAIRSCDLAVDLIECDYELQRVTNNIKRMPNAGEVEVHGRGGTDLTKILDYIEATENNKKARLVLMTDGETPFREAPSIDCTVIYTKNHSKLNYNCIRYDAPLEL